MGSFPPRSIHVALTARSDSDTQLSFPSWCPFSSSSLLKMSSLFLRRNDRKGWKRLKGIHWEHPKWTRFGSEAAERVTKRQVLVTVGMELDGSGRGP